MHSSDPKSYGTNRPGGIQYIETMPYLPASAPMGFMGSTSYGMAELQREEAIMQPTQQSSSHPHLWAAGMVTVAIILLFTLGLAFPGSVQF